MLSAYGDELKFEDYKKYFGDHYDVKEDHRKAIIIMNKINQAKNKTDVRILSMLLEVELDYLEQETHKNREYLELNINESKRYLYRENISHDDIKNILSGIEEVEKSIQSNGEALKIIEQWREEYLN